MSGNVPKLKPKQEAAIVALLSTRSVEEAARSVKVAVKTLYRWLKESDFDAAYRKARRDTFGQTIARLQQGSPVAAAVLLKMVVDVQTPPSTRVRAAEIVLDKAAKAIELEDIEARLAELERAAAEAKNKR
jgi:putative insertion element HTH domain-containing protein